MQLKVLLNRQLPSKVKDNPSSVEQFFDVVLDSHIIAAVLEFFGLLIRNHNVMHIILMSNH